MTRPAMDHLNRNVFWLGIALSITLAPAGANATTESGALHLRDASLSALSTTSGIKTVTLKLGGMHCAACSLKIRKALKALNGVEKLSEGKSKKHLLVRFEASLVTQSQLVKAVKEAGYQATVVP